MADDKTPKEPGGLTEKADANKERVSEVSNVSRTINQMQKKVDQELAETGLNTTDYDQIKEVQNSMIKVLSSLSYTVSQIGRGFTKVAADTAAASKETIKQYSSAIGQDINYNKKNTVAMALAKTSPLMGYFVAKFMETDIWKSATDKMKENAGKALGSVGTGIKSLFTGGKKTGGSKQGKGNTAAKLSKLSQEKIPKMHSGGYVEKGGLARLHAAEVVMPVDKLLSKMDEQVSVQRTLARQSVLIQSRSMAKMGTYVGDLNNPQKSGLTKGFFKALSDVQNQYQEPSDKRSLRALLAIQEAIGAQVGTMTQVWQKMLIEHPVFRNFLYMGKVFKRIFKMPFKPIYAFFKSRGGYKGHLSKSHQPLQALSENIGVLYTGSMYRLDAISMYTRATAEATRDMSTMFTGRKYKGMEGITTGRWSYSKIFRGLTNSITKGVIQFGGKWLGGFTNLFATKLPMWLGKKALGKDTTKKHSGIKWESLTKYFKELAETLTDRRLTRELPGGVGGLFRRGGYSKQQESIYGSAQEVISNLGEDLLPEPIRKFSLMENAIPVAIVNYSGKAVPIMEANQEEMKNVVNGFQNIEKKLDESKKSEKKTGSKVIDMAKASAKISKKNLKENAEMNNREKRKSMFGMGKWIAKILMLLPMLLTKLGLGNMFMRFFAGRIMTKVLGKTVSTFMSKIFKKTLAKKVSTKITQRLAKEAAKKAAKKAAKEGVQKGVQKTAGKAAAKATKKAAKKGLTRAAQKAAAKKASAELVKKTIAKKAAKKVAKKVALKAGLKIAGRVAAKLAGPVGIGLMAFEGGWLLGKGIDKMLGISEKFASMMDKTDKRATKLANEVSVMQKTSLEQSKKGGDKGYEDKRTIELQSSFDEASYQKRKRGKLNLYTGGLFGDRYKYKTKDRRDDVGFFGRRHMLAIDSAQKKFQSENKTKYSIFTPRVLRAARNAWLKSGGYGAKWLLTNPEKYGKKREAHFLKYLQKHYTPMTEEKFSEHRAEYKKHTEETFGVKVSEQQITELEKGEESSYDTAVREANKRNLNQIRRKKLEKKRANKDKETARSKKKQEIQDKVKEIEKTAEQLAAEAKVKTMAQAEKIKEELQKQTKAAMENTKDLRGTVSQGLTQTSNNISSSVQNMNQVYNNSTTPALSDQTQSVVSGNVE